MPHAEPPSASPKTISTTLNYHLPSAHPPNAPKEIHLGTASEKLRKHNTQPVLIADIRCCSDETFTIDQHGFQFIPNCLSSLTTGDGEPNISFNAPDAEEVYFNECIDLIKAATGATRVVPWTRAERRTLWQDAIKAAEKALAEDGDGAIVEGMNPAMSVHVDQSFKGAEKTLRARMPTLHASEEEVERLMRGRWGIINLWRPLRPVHREPIAVCSFPSLNDSTDLIPMNLVFPGKHAYYGRGASEDGWRFERWDIAYNPKHKWYYASDMQPDECWLIKCFDSKEDVARCAPHSAFESENDYGPARESVEVRCFVFWENDEA